MFVFDKNHVCPGIHETRSDFVSIFSKIPRRSCTLWQPILPVLRRAVARHDNWGGGGGGGASRPTLSKEIRRAEHEHMNIPPPPLTIGLATVLVLRRFFFKCFSPLLLSFRESFSRLSCSFSYCHFLLTTKCHCFIISKRML